jgi:hypothetical protein
LRASQIVELSFGARSGSGYLLTPRHVLTARHVIDPAQLQAVGTVRALAPADVDSLELSRTERPAPWPAHAAWISDTHDLAIVQLDADPGLQIERLRFGLVPRDELKPYLCFGIGFPAAAGALSHQIEARLSWVLDDRRFNLDIATALPKKWRDWAGLSGAVIFASGLPVGVVRTVKGDWNGLLTATPVQHLIEDQGFCKFWSDTGLATPGKEIITPLQQTVRHQVSSLIYRLDRKHTSGQIVTRLRGLNASTPPQVIMIPGRDEDEHRHIVEQLSQDSAVQRILGRSAASDQVIIDLPWPAEEQEIDADLWFDQVIDRFCKRIRVDPPASGQSPDLQRLRQRLDEASTPKAYWVLVRRAIAIAGHGKLLQRLLDFWHSLPPGKPIVLLICLAWDEPAASTNSLLSFLPRKQRQPDPELEPAITLAIDQHRLTAVDELALITGDHIGPWIDELRDTCRVGSGMSGNFDVLRVSLLNRIGDGKRLRRVSADIGDLLNLVER